MHADYTLAFCFYSSFQELRLPFLTEGCSRSYIFVAVITRWLETGRNLFKRGCIQRLILIIKYYGEIGSWYWWIKNLMKYEFDFQLPCLVFICLMHITPICLYPRIKIQKGQTRQKTFIIYLISKSENQGFLD